MQFDLFAQGSRVNNHGVLMDYEEVIILVNKPLHLSVRVAELENKWFMAWSARMKNQGRDGALTISNKSFRSKQIAITEALLEAMNTKPYSKIKPMQESVLKYHKNSGKR